MWYSLLSYRFHIADARSVPTPSPHPLLPKTTLCDKFHSSELIKLLDFFFSHGYCRDSTGRVPPQTLSIWLEHKPFIRSTILIGEDVLYKFHARHLEFIRLRYSAIDFKVSVGMMVFLYVTNAIPIQFCMRNRPTTRTLTSKTNPNFCPVTLEMLFYSCKPADAIIKGHLLDAVQAEQSLYYYYFASPYHVGQLKLRFNTHLNSFKCSSMQW